MSDRAGSFLGGLAIPISDAEIEAQRLARYKKSGVEAPPAKASPLKRAVQWVSDKLGSRPAAASAEAAPVDPDVNRHFTSQEWAAAPEYTQSNPAWEGLPGDELAMKEGA